MTTTPGGTLPAGPHRPGALRALTVRPPWSWAIAHGGKLVENRSWSRTWRGQLAIHAGKRWDFGGEDSPLVQRAWKAAGHTNPNPWPGDPAIVLGAIVAVADLVDICTVQGGYTDCDCGEWAAPFRCHWRLDNVRPLAEPVPCRGAQGLWPVPPDIARAIRAAAGGDAP